MSMPRDFTVNGIGRLGITISSAQGFEPLQENSLEFTGVSFYNENSNSQPASNNANFDSWHFLYMLAYLFLRSPKVARLCRELV
jgi:hypothetical protein